MKKIIIFAISVLSALSASAQSMKIDSFNLDSLHLEGAQCKFDERNHILLASDWSKKYWIKIDGKMVEFESEQTDSDIEQMLESKRWRVSLKKDGISVLINLVEVERGDDTAAFRGYLEVSRNGARKRILVAGGCGA